MTFETEILIATIGVVASVGSVVATYLFTKKQEIELSIKNNKMVRYDDLVSNLTRLVETHGKTAQQFIDAYYRAGAYATIDVLDACMDLLRKIEGYGGMEFEISDEIFHAIENIYNAVRRDTLSPKEPDYGFKAYHVKAGRVIP